MRKHHTVSGIRFTDTTMSLVIDGVQKSFELAKLSPRLANASAQERSRCEVSPSGYGIHWPLIDEDLSIDGLLGIVHSPATQKKTA